MSNLIPTHHDIQHDVIVVGARCAGAATAMLLARRGHDVLVVDRATLPSDTLSTHSIARGGIVQLHRWGLLDDVVASGAPPIRKAVFHSGGSSVEREIKESAGVDHVLAPRRHVLDRIMADAAVSAGATLTTGASVEGITRTGDGRVTGVYGRDRDGLFEHRARLVIGADGVRSRIARAVGAPTLLARRPTGATHYAYFAGPDWDGTEYFLGDRAFSGIFPTHHGEACVWVCLPAHDAAGLRRPGESSGVTFDRMLRHASPQLVERLADACRTTPMRGASGLPNHVIGATGPGWALVGDAGYHRDPITGHGITDALRDAELLADAADAMLRGTTDERDAMAAYQTRRDRMLRPIFDLTCALGRFPAPDRFVEIQRDLGRAIEHEAVELAERPVPATAVG
ncbi:MAG: NAD(P)/FAD-dependent oxidoreductase [Ilumatobacteraceae bacterium]